jgi:hypothetical protein
MSRRLWSMATGTSLLGVALCGAPSHAADAMVQVRYEAQHEVGIGVEEGGLSLATGTWPSVGIPAWATWATVTVSDDLGVPVAGRVGLRDGPPPSWAGRAPSASHTMCSGHQRSFTVPPGGSMELRVVAGAMVKPTRAPAVGDGSRAEPCAVSPSTPTRGTITVVFRR